MIAANDIVIVGNYKIIETIGVGAFSEVFKGIHIKTGQIVALKKMGLNEKCRKQVAKEVLIHQHLRHQNIIKFVEAFEHSENIYIVQEFASGGELFEQIEPDVGFPEQVAHFYFVQLIRSIVYLHKSGVCHRDLKPENLLLDGQGNLKLTDFGLSTLFQKGKTRRKLTTRCGTPAYMSPEVSRATEYEGDDSDIWSCCVILVVLLTGNLPWDTATNHCSEFVSHIKHSENSRINSLPDGPKRIINRVLQIDPTKRMKASDISSDPWFLQENFLFNFKFMASDPEALIKLIRENCSTQMFSLSVPLALTQPDQVRARTSGVVDCFSQPQVSVNLEVDSNESSKVFVRNNFARFLCHGSVNKISDRLEQVLQKMLVPFQRSCQNNSVTVFFQTVDRRKCPLVGHISLQIINESVLVVVKKNRGNPIEYVRFFKFIVDQFLDLI